MEYFSLILQEKERFVEEVRGLNQKRHFYKLNAVKAISYSSRLPQIKHSSAKSVLQNESEKSNFLTHLDKHRTITFATRTIKIFIHKRPKQSKL